MNEENQTINNDCDAIITSNIPNPKRELIKSVSVSLTDSDKNLLNSFATKINFLLLDAGKHQPKAVNKSDLIRSFIRYVDKMNNEELLAFFTKNTE